MELRRDEALLRCILCASVKQGGGNAMYGNIYRTTHGQLTNAGHSLQQMIQHHFSQSSVVACTVWQSYLVGGYSHRLAGPFASSEPLQIGRGMSTS